MCIFRSTVQQWVLRATCLTFVFPQSHSCQSLELLWVGELVGVMFTCNMDRRLWTYVSPRENRKVSMRPSIRTLSTWPSTSFPMLLTPHLNNAFKNHYQITFLTLIVFFLGCLRVKRLNFNSPSFDSWYCDFMFMAAICLAILLQVTYQ